MRMPVIVIEGYLNRIVIRVVVLIDNMTLSFLRSEFRKFGFRFDPYKLIWWKDSKNIDEDLCQIEEFLLEHKIPFINRHMQYSSSPDYY